MRTPYLASDQRHSPDKRGATGDFAGGTHLYHSRLSGLDSIPTQEERDRVIHIFILIMYFVKNKEDRRKVTFPLVDYAELEGAN